MTYTIASLGVQLKTLIPTVDSFPADSVYEDAIRTAIVNFNHKCPVISELDLTFTDALTYPIPTDLVYFIDLSRSMVGNFTYNFVTRTIVFTSAPKIQGTFTYRYAKGIALPSANNVAIDIDDFQMPLVMLAGRYYITVTQANQLSQNAFSYTLGTQSLDRRNTASDLRATARTLEDQLAQGYATYNRSQVTA